MTDLTSVHFKQKTEAGVLSEVGDGFVNFRAIAEHLKTQALYRGSTPRKHTDCAFFAGCAAEPGISACGYVVGAVLAILMSSVQTLLPVS